MKIGEFLTIKTEPCSQSNCSYRKRNTADSLMKSNIGSSEHVYNCFGYHGQDDKRRVPYCIDAYQTSGVNPKTQFDKSDDIKVTVKILSQISNTSANVNVNGDGYEPSDSLSKKTTSNHSSDIVSANTSPEVIALKYRASYIQNQFVYSSFNGSDHIQNYSLQANPICNNWIQYLYHPLIYKTLACPFWKTTVTRRVLPSQLSSQPLSSVPFLSAQIQSSPSLSKTLDKTLKITATNADKTNGGIKLSKQLKQNDLLIGDSASETDDVHHAVYCPFLHSGQQTSSGLIKLRSQLKQILGIKDEIQGDSATKNTRQLHQVFEKHMSHASQYHLSLSKEGKKMINQKLLNLILLRNSKSKEDLIQKQNRLISTQLIQSQADKTVRKGQSDIFEQSKQSKCISNNHKSCEPQNQDWNQIEQIKLRLLKRVENEEKIERLKFFEQQSRKIPHPTIDNNVMTVHPVTSATSSLQQTNAISGTKGQQKGPKVIAFSNQQNNFISNKTDENRSSSTKKSQNHSLKELQNPALPSSNQLQSQLQTQSQLQFHQSQQLHYSNTATTYEYFHHREKLPLVQDRHTQFKAIKDLLDPNNHVLTHSLVVKYIVAFLNTGEGGKLFIGIDNNSVVCGCRLSQSDYDQLLLNIDQEARFNAYPPIMPHKYSIRRIPVRKNDDRFKFEDRWVIQISVKPQNLKNKKVYLHNRQCFMRMNASTHKLNASDLMEYFSMISPNSEISSKRRLTESSDEFDLENNGELRSKNISIKSDEKATENNKKQKQQSEFLTEQAKANKYDDFLNQKSLEELYVLRSHEEQKLIRIMNFYKKKQQEKSAKQFAKERQFR